MSETGSAIAPPAPPPGVRLPAIVPPFLSRPTRPLVTLLLAYLTTILGSLMLAAIVQSFAPQAESPDFSQLSGVTALVALVLFAPLVETLIMGLFLSILLRFCAPATAIAISAIGWGVAHSVQAATWGLVIWWPFLIFSTLYVVWKQRSLAWGLAMPFLVHAMQNSLPALAVAYPDRFAALI
ncbi:CPBP family intramembrane glutamic endopeptidase [Sphingomicrobium astaxanthinifaciens]|uniref:CPBP family intramembrane glutamic endopeptidase n=1 Tax=Sphingomicrobium astaxanthinifaciens TaxID=1227949 RepID=UPI001FCA821C|nr:CPBP family intramembrane glutamic endopeptidase [Sphingomicrobium astaxanthinifaciens]MCJ7420266.1 CPBP family intramembrane metalloprotease [Sphingomicrobium astaxanthinifaciens]